MHLVHPRFAIAEPRLSDTNRVELAISAECLEEAPLDRHPWKKLCVKARYAYSKATATTASETASPKIRQYIFGYVRAAAPLNGLGNTPETDPLTRHACLSKVSGSHLVDLAPGSGIRY